MTGVLNHLWQSSLFALAAASLTLVLKRNGARTRYWLWFAASVKFLIPFSVVVEAGNRLQWRSAPAIVQPVSSIPLEQVFTAPGLLLAAPVVARHAPDYLPAVLATVWLCGFLMVVSAWGRQWHRIYVAIRLGRPAGLKLPITTMFSATLLEPGVFGIFRPILLLPEGITKRLLPEELEAIIAHELCHIRRCDNLAAAVHMLGEAIFWFHPMLWWIGKRLVDERERACDEEVLRLGSEPRVYAEGILKVCELYLESPLDCVSGITGSDLRERIRTIMTLRVADKLDLGRKLLLMVAGIAAIGGPFIFGQAKSSQSKAQAAPVAFEVASVRPSGRGNSDSGGFKGEGKNVRELAFQVEHRRVTIPNFNLFALIVGAYGLRSCRPRGGGDCVLLSGGPDWLRKDEFNIVAKMPDDAPDYTLTLAQFQNGQGPQLQLMLQALLADRFRLRLHSETKQVPVYALTLGKKGPKFNTADGSGEPKIFFRSQVLPQGQEIIHLFVKNGSMQELADLYSKFMDRPVLDRTGLKDRYDFTMDYEADADAPGPFAKIGGPGLFKAFEEQAGLKLEATKGPVEVLVIDHAEKPSAN